MKNILNVSDYLHKNVLTKLPNTAKR